MGRATFAAAALLLCASGAHGVAQGVSPVQKVIALLDENKMKIAADLAAEEKEMAAYATFCDDELTEKGYAIKTATRSILDLKASIEDGEARTQELEAEVAQLGTEMAAKEKQLAGADAERGAGNSNFKKTEGELLTSVDELERAIVQLKKGESFLQTSGAKHDVQARIRAALAAIGRIVDASSVEGHSQKALAGLLQTAKDDGNDDLSLTQAAASGAGTGDILEKIEEMKEKAEDGLSDARNAEMKAQHSYDMMAQSLNNAIKVSKEKLSAAKSGISTATEEMGKATGELTETEKSKKSDEVYVESLTQECEQTKAAWAERQASAKEEMEVIEKAKGILADRVKVLVQFGGKTSSHSTMKAAHLDEDGDSVREADARSRVVAKLKDLSHRFHSFALMEMVSAAGADPFEKIRGLIEDMIAKLLNEANEEATQKAFCDEEMGKSKSAKEDKSMKFDKLTARIEKATTTKAELEGSVKDLEAEIAALDAGNAEATKLREEERSSYLVASKDFKDAAEAVSEAIAMLKEYYEGALLQTGAHAARAPSFGGAKSDAAHVIISILEMSGEDFEKLYMESEQAEAMAVEDYKKLMQENAVSKTAKQAEIKGAQSEIKSLDVAIKNGEEDADTTSKELDAILSYMDKLKPQCETKEMSYAEKKSRREAEIEGLKEALSILSGEIPGL